MGVVAMASGLLGGGRAAAVVSHDMGYRATVAGFTSWYGSYRMGALGTAWCIDHGIAAPDPDLGYVPTQPAAPADTLTGMAWMLGAQGTDRSAVTHAALMLALHDFMGAAYPTGRLDLDQPLPMAGFGPDGPEV